MESSVHAHSLDGRPEAEWEPLSDHLDDVARLAEGFAGKFGAGDWGSVAGRLHDIGKLSPAFQQLLRGRRAKVDHSTAGARIVA